MKILVIGSGGREHALAWKLGLCRDVEQVYVAPGNAGTASQANKNVNVLLADSDAPELINFSRKEGIDLVIVGPEAPLVAGLADKLFEAGILVFGPCAAAARLEGSKAFAKKIMLESSVPTANFEIFDDFGEAKRYLEKCPLPIVIKADGLAAGKGVAVVKDRLEALNALHEMMVRKIFGQAGEVVVIEEALSGEEVSFLALVDGENILPLPSCQDHKAVFDGDLGPNTGGMGAYSPAPILPESEYARTCDLLVKPIVKTLARQGIPYKGVLYAGIMMTADGPKVLEYNVRFGDPECQPLLMRLKSDLAEACLACALGTLDKINLQFTQDSAVCVVMAAEGYPRSYKKGIHIQGLDEAAKDGAMIFHAGTAIADNGEIISAGGRVLGVTALGKDLAQARENAYQAVHRIQAPGLFYRTDIGEKGLQK